LLLLRVRICIDLTCLQEILQIWKLPHEQEYIALLLWSNILKTDLL